MMKRYGYFIEKLESLGFELPTDNLLEWAWKHLPDGVTYRLKFDANTELYEFIADPHKPGMIFVSTAFNCTVPVLDILFQLYSMDWLGGSNTSRTPPNTGYESIPQPLPFYAKTVHCAYCGKKFWRKYSYKAHYALEHIVGGR